ncbi:MAG: glycerate kinase [Solirubrobacterales bacterium]|nr:glycerate kinase [Solirubrobacterales bacterium]
MRATTAGAAALAAPDSFKGTHTAAEAAGAIARGLERAGVRCDELPLADGGEGTAEVLSQALGGELRSASVHDPLGRQVEAGFTMLPDGRAVVEVAAASGLPLVPEPERDAWLASTRGTGELIALAAEAGASEVLVAAGGSATTDGGAGALSALAAAAAKPRLKVLCDVRVPFERAAQAFGPQKGADEGTVKRLEDRLSELAAAAPRDPRGRPLTGAAGGLAGGLWAHLGASLVAGAPFVFDALGFDSRLASASPVVTGEGRLDAGTLEGKVVSEVAARCRGAGTPCHAIVGAADLSDGDLAGLGLAGVTEASSLGQIERAAERLAAQPGS